MLSSTRRILRWLFFPLGLALLLSAAFIQEGSALNSQLPTPTFEPDFDRLAEPTLPASPSQADIGAQDFWLYCMACHGDQGQGLTEEFRQLYPPEEQNCWTSGCHGRRHYQYGFTLPTAIPAVISPGRLDKFSNAAVMHAFIQAAMPWHKPASLDDEIYWRLTAFLLRENGVENPYDELGPDNAEFIPLGSPGANALQTADLATSTAQPTASELLPNSANHLPLDERQNSTIAAGLLAVFLLVLGGLYLLCLSLLG